MAEAAAALGTSPSNDRFNLIARLLVKSGTKIIRKVFDSIHDPSNLQNALQIHQATLESLRRKRILSEVEWNKLYPSNASYGKSRDFDLTLLFKLIRNICNLTAPSTGWDKLPNDTDLSLEADIVRIKYHRNVTFAHNDEIELSEDEFDDCWKEISGALLRIVGYYKPSDVGEWKKQIAISRTSAITEEDRKSFLFPAVASEAEKEVEEVTETIEKLSLDGGEVSLVHGPLITDRKSKFQAHFAEVTSKEEVDQVLSHITKNLRHAEITNTIWAYRVYEADKSDYIHASDDGGEYLAGRRLEHLLNDINISNVVIIVTCWDGDVYLGLEKFKNINECALNLLMSHGGMVQRMTPDEVALFLEKIEKYFEARKHKAAYTAYALAQEAKPTTSAAKHEIIHSDTITVPKSSFQAHLARVTSQQQVEQVLDQLKDDRKIQRARFNMLAYMIYDEEKKENLEASRDDGEKKGGKRLLHLLQTSEVKNAVVIVTRWKEGDVKLGPERFKYINACATEVIKMATEHKWIEAKASGVEQKESKKKGKKKSTKK